MSADDDSKKAPAPRTSSQMEAVMRLMTGKEERTIAEKFADSNRPTWEQYKKDNEDKLNIEGMDERKMQAYRKELDQQREKILSRGINHSKKKKKKRRHESSSSSDDESSDRKRKHSRKKKRRKKKKHKRRDYSSSDDNSDSDSCSDDSHRKRRKHKKKKRKHKRKKGDDDEDEGVMDDRYRLSNFFTKGSDDE